MPKQLHDALARAGRKKGYKGERLDHFVYGTMTNMGFHTGAQKKKRKVR